MALGLDEGFGVQVGGDINATSCCLAMMGLSTDATEREVQVLFSNCPGFLRCMVVPPKEYGKKTYAFIQFDTQENAVNAGNSRQGSCWPNESQAVTIEMSRKDIPADFHARTQRKGEPSYGKGGGWAEPPAAKWAKGDDSYGGKGKAVEGKAVEGSPKTLHVGGLPFGIQQGDLDEFLHNNFASECLGGKIAGGGNSGKGGGARAFIGFISHEAAATAQGALEGFCWDGSTLHAEWARTEFRAEPPAGKGKDEWGAELPLIQRNLMKGAKAASKGPPVNTLNVHSGKGGGENQCTLHFTGLPPVSDAEFGQFVSMTFPDQVTFSRFVDNQDGRPPVAWVRFVDPMTASAIASAHSEFEWLGKQVGVKFARSELDPSKASKGKGK